MPNNESKMDHNMLILEKDSVAEIHPLRTTMSHNAHFCDLTLIGFALESLMLFIDWYGGSCNSVQGVIIGRKYLIF